jgi:hypothetical protein
MRIPEPKRTMMAAGWFAKKLRDNKQRACTEGRDIAYELPEEEAEAPCSGLAITRVVVTTSPPGSVVSPVLVINGGVVTVTIPLIVSVIDAGVAKVDSGLSVIVLTVVNTGPWSIADIVPRVAESVVVTSGSSVGTADTLLSRP